MGCVRCNQKIQRQSNNAISTRFYEYVHVRRQTHVRYEMKKVQGSLERDIQERFNRFEGVFRWILHCIFPAGHFVFFKHLVCFLRKRF